MKREHLERRRHKGFGSAIREWEKVETQKPENQNLEHLKKMKAKT